MEHKLCKTAFGFAAGIMSALMVLLIVVVGYLGFSKEVTDYLALHHTVAAATPLAVLIAIVIAAVKGFIFGYVFAWFYNLCPIHSHK